MFFNVSREKLGRPDQFNDDVLDAVWATVGDLHPLTRAMFFYMLSSQYNYKYMYVQKTAQRRDVLARVFESRELGNKTTAEGA